MPKTWTETHIHVSDQLREGLTDSEYEILREVALDALNNPGAWTQVDDYLRCSFLGRDGLQLCVEIGVATIDSALATVFFVRVKDASLCDLSVPLTRIEEFEKDYVDIAYESKAVSEEPVLKVRLGHVRRLQPMKYDLEE